MAKVQKEIRSSNNYTCDLRGLEDCLNEVTYVDEKVAYVIDVEGNALRFLRYGGGAVLDRLNPDDMEPDRLRKACLASYRRGLPFTLSLGGAQSVETLWDPASFPRACFDRESAFAYETWSALLRPAEGEETPEEFVPNSDFRIVLVTTSTDAPPKCLRELVSVVTVAVKKSRKGQDAVAEAYGVKEVIRNSKALVEAAFDGDLDGVKQQLEQGYSVESTDGKKQTALSEAALQGHEHVVTALIEVGADPNAQCKKGRTPLYRASFHSHIATMTLLLEAGGDPQIADTSGLWPANVCEGGHADEAKALLEGFPRERTEALIAVRLENIEAAKRDRVTTAAGRELAARDSIRRELIELAMGGDAEALRARLDKICADADDAYPRERPRATAEARDARGHTLLAIAAWKGRRECVELLLNTYPTLEFATGPPPGQYDEDPDKTKRLAWRVNVNTRNSAGWTPLQLASFHNHVDIAKLLVAAEADPSIANRFGMTAYTLAPADSAPMREALGAWDDNAMRGSWVKVAAGGTCTYVPSEAAGQVRHLEVLFDEKVDEAKANGGMKAAKPSKALKKGGKKKKTGVGGKKKGGTKKKGGKKGGKKTAVAAAATAAAAEAVAKAEAEAKAKAAAPPPVAICMQCHNVVRGSNGCTKCPPLIVAPPTEAGAGAGSAEEAVESAADIVGGEADAEADADAVSSPKRALQEAQQLDAAINPSPIDR